MNCLANFLRTRIGTRSSDGSMRSTLCYGTSAPREIGSNAVASPPPAAAKPYLCTAAGESCRRGANREGKLYRHLRFDARSALRGKLPVDRLTSGRLKLDDVNQGFDRLHECKAVRQVVVL